jgi:hypothetical protein
MFLIMPYCPHWKGGRMNTSLNTWLTEKAALIEKEYTKKAREEKIIQPMRSLKCKLYVPTGFRMPWEIVYATSFTDEDIQLINAVDWQPRHARTLRVLIKGIRTHSGWHYSHLADINKKFRAANLPWRICSIAQNQFALGTIIENGSVSIGKVRFK